MNLIDVLNVLIPDAWTALNYMSLDISSRDAQIALLNL